MRISAIILCHNSQRYVEKCIDSLTCALAGSDESDEILVVDNGSQDGTCDLLKGLEQKYAGTLKVTFLKKNGGTTAPRNIALRQSIGRYVLIIDSDVEVPQGTLEPLLARLDRDPTCGIVAPMLKYPSGRRQISTDEFPTVRRKLQRFFALKRMEQQSDQWEAPTEPRTVDYAISAFWLMRRDVLEKVGLFDERIFYSPEDVDYCLRVWEAGYSVVYDPSVYAVHDAQEISRGFRLRRATFSHAAGLLYLFRKHGYAFGRRRLYQRLNRFARSGA